MKTDQEYLEEIMAHRSCGDTECEKLRPCDECYLGWIRRIQTDARNAGLEEAAELVSVRYAWPHIGVGIRALKQEVKGE